MEKYFTNDSTVFYLNKFAFESKTDSEFTIDFGKTLQFISQNECALVEINLPKDIYLPLIYGDFKLKTHFLVLEFPSQLDDLKAKFIKKDSQPLQMEEEYDLSDHYFTLDDFIKDIQNRIDLFKLEAIKLLGQYFDNVYTIVDGKPVFNAEMGTIAEILVDFNKEDKQVKLLGNPGIFWLFMNEKSTTDNDYRRKSAIYWISFNKELHDALGIQESHFPLGVNKLSKQKQVLPLFLDELNSPIIKRLEPFIPELIFVYSDILKESYVNSDRVNVLRIIPWSKDRNSMSFKNQIFIPLRIEEMSSITISLRDVSGSKFYYDKGVISLNIMIRPISNI